MGRLGLAYRTTDQEHCPHDAKLKMAGFKDRYECTMLKNFVEKIVTASVMKYQVERE